MRENIDECICDECGLYWPCKTAVKRYLKAHKKTKVEDTFDFANVSDEFERDAEMENNKNPESGPMPIFEDMRSHVKSPFVQLTDEIMDSE